MRKILILMALIASSLLISCSEDTKVDDGKVDGSGFTDPDKVYLSSFSATKIPDYDDWVINDTKASTADFKGLSAAINALADSEREITLSFPKIDTIPQYAIFGVEKIDYDAFDASAVVSVSADVAAAVGSYAFALCKNLATIDFPAVSEVYSYSFLYNESLTELSSTQFPNLSSIGNGTFSYCNALTSVNLPKVTSIGNNTFDSCTQLSAVAMDKVEAIGKYAFSNCKALTTIELPAAITLDNGVFSSCNALTAAYLPEATVLKDMVFYFCAALDTVELPKAQSIGSNAFYSCLALSSISLPAAGWIGAGAFDSCAVLDLVELPVAKEIGSKAFRSCGALQSIELPMLTSVSSEVFFGSSALATIEVPAASVINTNAFYNCTALNALTIATASEVTLSKVSSTAFTAVDASQIALTVGAANSAMVDGSELNVGGVRTTFASIATL